MSQASRAAAAATVNRTDGVSISLTEQRMCVQDRWAALRVSAVCSQHSSADSEPVHRRGIATQSAAAGLPHSSAIGLADAIGSLTKTPHSPPSTAAALAACRDEHDRPPRLLPQRDGRRRPGARNRLHNDGGDDRDRTTGPHNDASRGLELRWTEGKPQVRIVTVRGGSRPCGAFIRAAVSNCEEMSHTAVLLSCTT
jgi:hypothetical protein